MGVTRSYSSRPFLCALGIVNIIFFSIKETGLVQDFKEGGNALRGNCKPGFPTGS